jgi:1-acyl-sn-glycerol-3-phosphate acyltransferase
MTAASELSRRLKIPTDGVVAVFNAPPGYEASSTGELQVDVVELFAQNRASLERDLPSAFSALKPGGRLWVMYPSPGSGRATDLSRNHGWGALHAAGLTATDDARVDSDWDAMRFEMGAEIPGADMLPVGRTATPVFRIARLIALPLFHAMFRLDMRGRERIPNTAYVLIANHLGWMDAISLLLLFPPEPRIHYLADPTSMMRNRPLWTLVRAAGGIVPVDRAQRGNTVLFEHVERCLAKGGVVALFPEGDFGPREGELLPFKKGFAHFAAGAGVPVLPVALAGMKEVWLGKRLFVRIGAPIPTAGRSVDEIWALGERAVHDLLPPYTDPGGRKPLKRWLTGLF